ncbi:MAG: molybdate ABC transporter permease subunit [Acidobacteria bacterium]|nr:molybdate ABC transporter permease subunit [Acidobacteriota bacterium]
MNWSALLISVRVSLLATAGLTLIGLALAYLLARLEFRGKMVVETLINLPMILPPSVVGYYLLIILGRRNPLIAWYEWQILFTWQGAVIASTIVGIPLMTQASRAALASIDPVIENAARTLGSTEWQVFRRVTLPLARRGILAGIILGGARAMGEFGATLMIAGNIPGRTQTLPLAIYDAVLSQRYEEANQMVLVMTLVAFVGLWLVRRLEEPGMKLRG